MTQTAQIHNLSLVRGAAERLSARIGSLPGLAVLYGPSGYGKTTAALAIANEYRAYFVQMRSAWGRKTLLEKILLEMGLQPSGTIPKMLDTICEQLASSGRMLIIDEFDYCTRSDSLIELARDIYEGSQSPLLVIGEELLPEKLKTKKWEKIHGRVYSWIPASPATLADARTLAPIYCPGVAIADDLLDFLVKKANGSVRRVCVNMTLIHEAANVEGRENIDLATWGKRPIYTGEAPRRAS